MEQEKGIWGGLMLWESLGEENRFDGGGVQAMEKGMRIFTFFPPFLRIGVCLNELT